MIAPDGRVQSTLRLPPGVHVLATDARRLIASHENDDGDVDIIVFEFI